jgi:hypothetical protein
MRFPCKVFKRTSVPAGLPLLIAVGVWLAILIPQAQAATVTANPPKLAFGDVQINQTSTLPVVLTNTGNSRVTITQDQVRGTYFSTDLTVPITLKVGQQITIHVTFAPKTEGMHYGNVSASNSNGLVVKIPVNGNATSGHSVGLSWDPSTSKDIVGYNIYRATRSRGPYEKINSDLDTATSYLDDTVLSGRTYYYVTTAVDSNAQESKHSNRVKAIIP